MSLSKVSSIPASLWKSYNTALENYPHRTKTITAAAIAIMGDLVSQYLQGQRWDVTRTIRFALFGGVLSYILGKWYYFLDKVVDTRLDWTPIRKNTVKVLLDQLILSPIITLFFFVFMGILEGNPGKIGSMLRHNYWATLITSYKVWPLAMIISFSLVPAELRVLWGNLVGFFWNIYLSSRTSVPSGKSSSSSSRHK